MSAASGASSPVPPRSSEPPGRRPATRVSLWYDPPDSQPHDIPWEPPEASRHCRTQHQAMNRTDYTSSSSSCSEERHAPLSNAFRDGPTDPPKSYCPPAGTHNDRKQPE